MEGHCNHETYETADDDNEDQSWTGHNERSYLSNAGQMQVKASHGTIKVMTNILITPINLTTCRKMMALTIIIIVLLAITITNRSSMLELSELAHAADHISRHSDKNSRLEIYTWCMERLLITHRSPTVNGVSGISSMDSSSTGEPFLQMFWGMFYTEFCIVMNFSSCVDRIFSIHPHLSSKALGNHGNCKNAGYRINISYKQKCNDGNMNSNERLRDSNKKLLLSQPQRYPLKRPRHLFFTGVRQQFQSTKPHFESVLLFIQVKPTIVTTQVCTTFWPSMHHFSSMDTTLYQHLCHVFMVDVTPGYRNARWSTMNPNLNGKVFHNPYKSAAHT